MGATRLASGHQGIFSNLVLPWGFLLYLPRRETRLLKNAPMLGKENCYKYFRISLKMSSFTSNNTL